MTILLVDDNDINLFALEKLLHSSGFENCVKLSSAQDLFDYLNKPNKQMEVDLILLDVMMPNIDGIEACKRIRENESFNNIQIIFVTALEDKLRLAEALDIGGNDYVSKPIDKTELLARIRVALRLKKELDWHTAYDRKIEKELTLASEVQRNLLSRPIQNDDIQIAVSYMPSAKLAGDMYYWHKIDDNKYAVILIDMMGHGISASLVCMYISSILHEAIKTIRDPELVMRELNRHMALLPTKEDEIPYYFTAIYFIIDTSKKTLEYVNAGHPACYVKIDDAPSSTLDSNALPIGFFDEIVVEKKMLHYEHSIQLILLTDGVIEAMDNDEFIAEKMLLKLTSSKWPYSNRIMDILLPSSEQEHQPDDMCLILIQADAHTPTYK